MAFAARSFRNDQFSWSGASRFNDQRRSGAYRRRDLLDGCVVEVHGQLLMGKIIHLIDRSRVEAREECGMLRHLGYDFEEEGGGLEPEAGSLPLLAGIAIHSAHARLLAGEGLEAIVSDVIAHYRAEIAERGLLGLDVTQEVIAEQAALLEGMLRMWAITRMPMILEEYDVESIEQKWDWELFPGLVQRLRLDAILRRKDDGLRFVLDYKSVGSPTDVWMEKFEHNLQTCLYLQGLKERTQEPVGGILYEGLVKGQFRKEIAHSKWFGRKIQHGPYTIAYTLRGRSAFETVYQTDYTNKKGYEKVRTFEEMSMKQWVEDHLVPNGMGKELFIIVPPIKPPDYELLRVKQQTINEEIRYLAGMEEYRAAVRRGDPNAEALLELYAPRRTGRCYKYGKDYKCKFMGICFNAGVNPLEDGYRKRAPHHDVDLVFTE